MISAETNYWSIINTGITTTKVRFIYAATSCTGRNGSRKRLRLTAIIKSINLQTSGTFRKAHCCLLHCLETQHKQDREIYILLPTAKQERLVSLRLTPTPSWLKAPWRQY